MKKPMDKTAFLLLLPFLMTSLVLAAGLLNGILQAIGYIPAYGLYNVSLDYFLTVIREKNLGKNIFLSLYIAAVSSVITIVLAVMISFSLVITKKDRGLLYNIIKIPMFIPWMVTAFLMVHLFSGSGFIARLLYNMGLTGLSGGMANFLYSPGSLGIIAAFVWACTPFACFFIVTAMSGISQTLGEAAQNLGANTFQLFKDIYVPLSLPAIRNIFMIVFLSCFGNYEIPMLLGMTAPRALPVEIYYEYNHYDLQNRPYAMALNTVMLFTALLISGLLYIFFHRGEWRRRKNDPK